MGDRTDIKWGESGVIHVLGFIIWCLLIWFSYVLENLMWPVKGGYYIIFEKTALYMRYILLLGGALLIIKKAMERVG